MLAAWLIIALSAAPPQIVVDAQLQPARELQRAAVDAWQRLDGIYQQTTDSVASTPSTAIRLLRDETPRPRQSGRSSLGRVLLRQNRPGHFDPQMRISLAHEIAHQFLMLRCPVAAEDTVFQEAFAVATSGEVELWSQASDYLSTPEAHRTLQRARSLDTPAARRALARLIVEGTPPGRSLPHALVRRLRLCAAGSRWREPLTLIELATPAQARGDALVVVSRHSGEIIESRGEVAVPMPFGSTLKPFVLAGSSDRAPGLRPVPARPMWRCGEDLPPLMRGSMALLRSCNGYFIDWADRDPAPRKLGAFGPLLVELGLARLPADIGEAIGLKPTLSISPWALAQAYRLLAESRPSLIELLQRNSEEGTLSGLPASDSLRGWATKTGTVRDPKSRPLLGWIVAVSDDLVVVKVRIDRAPRTFADELVRDLRRLREQAGQRQQVRVQTFGLVPAAGVLARCERLGIVAGPEPSRVDNDFQPLVGLVERGAALCLGAPWQVRFRDESPLSGVDQQRAYAGIFSLSAAPRPRQHDPNLTERQRRARRGSDFLFRTTAARYVAGVLRAEDSKIQGQPRVALGKVIAHNAKCRRHDGRPVCDTTHCQVFLGTQAPASGDEAIYAGRWRPRDCWLLFSRGGVEPWQTERSRSQVEDLLGANPTAFQFRDGKLLYRRTVVGPDGPYDESARLPCDLLRSRLRLLACPDRLDAQGEHYVISGRGEGHGQGLDVEWAKRSGLSAQAILDRAYGRR